MKNYTAPSSEMESREIENRPVRAIIYGLLISIIGVGIFSMVITVGFIILNQVDPTNQEAIRSVVSSSPIFMVLDLIGSLLILVVAGKVVAKYAPVKTMMFSIMVTAVVVLVYGSSMVMNQSFSAYPIWYSFAIGISMLLGIPLGAGFSRKNI